MFVWCEVFLQKCNTCERFLAFSNITETSLEIWSIVKTAKRFAKADILLCGRGWPICYESYPLAWWLSWLFVVAESVRRAKS